MPDRSAYKSTNTPVHRTVGVISIVFLIQELYNGINGIIIEVIGKTAHGKRYQWYQHNRND